MNKALRIAARLLALPFFAGIILVFNVVLWFNLVINFLVYGGEVLTYTKRVQPKSIGDVYIELEKRLKCETEDK